MILSEEQKKKALGIISGNVKPDNMSDDAYIDSLIENKPGNVVERITGNIQDRASNVNEALAGRGEFAGRSALSRGLSASAEIAGAVSSTGYESLPEKARNILDKIGGGISKGIEAYANIPMVKKAADALVNETDPKQLKKIENTLQGIADLGLIAGEITGASEIAGATKVAGQIGRKGVKEVAKTPAKIKQASSDLLEKTGISEAIPTKERIINSQVSKALDLTQGDVSNINLSTGNEVGEWIAQKNLIGKNKDATFESVKKLGDESYNKVRDEISNVDKTYLSNDVPRYKQALEKVVERSRSLGNEERLNEAMNLLKKEEITLSDIQKSKELMDDTFKLYSVTGDVAETEIKQGLANVRSELKELIEKEVLDNNGVDIKSLNNDVATSRSITDAIEKRSTRGLTRSNIGIGDLGAFGVGSTFGTPLAGIALVAGKKILESSAVQLRFSKWLDKLSDAKKVKLAKELSEGKVPKEMAEVIKLKIPKGGFTSSAVIQNEKDN